MQLPISIFRTFHSLIYARALLIATKLDFFETIHNNQGLSLEDLSEKTETDPQALIKMVRIFQEKKMLYMDSEQKLYLTKYGIKLFISRESKIRDYIQLQNHTWSRLNNLEYLINKNNPKLDYHDENIDKQTYLNGMHQVSRIFSNTFAKKIKLDSNFQTLLDVGGAASDYSRALKKRYPQLDITVLDLPNQIKNIQNNKELFNPDYNYIAGNIFEVTLKSHWDIILINNFIHLFSLSKVYDIVTKLYLHLNSGGKLIIFDQFFGINKLFNRFCYYIDMNYYTVGGSCHDKNDIFKMLKNNFKLKNIKFKPLYKFPPCALFQIIKQ